MLEVLVQHRRNTKAALKLLRRPLKHQGIHSEPITTGTLGSYRAVSAAAAGSVRKGSADYAALALAECRC